MISGHNIVKLHRLVDIYEGFRQLLRTSLRPLPVTNETVDEVDCCEHGQFLLSPVGEGLVESHCKLNLGLQLLHSSSIIHGKV